MTALPELINLLEKPESQLFIAHNSKADVTKLLLKHRSEPHTKALIEQIAARQKLQNKLPEWCAQPQIIFPPALHLEQASSQITARCKAKLISGSRFTDLTGGLGVDAFYLSENFEESTYNEPQESLKACAQHNFQILKRAFSFTGILAEALLPKLPPQDLIYLDPSRRNGATRKVFMLEHCQPGVMEMQNLLLQKAHTVLIKVSPMLDLSQAHRLLPSLAQIWIIAVKNEVKEVVLKLTHGSTSQPLIKTFNYLDNKKAQQYEVLMYQQYNPRYAAPCSYIYEPNAALMKSGGMDALAENFSLWKLAPHSHLYTGDTLLPNFPGRVFKLEAIHKPGSKDLQKQRFNIIARNFPQKAAEIARQLRIKPALKHFLIATTLHDQRKVLLQTQWLSPLNM